MYEWSQKCIVDIIVHCKPGRPLTNNCVIFSFQYQVDGFIKGSGCDNYLYVVWKNPNKNYDKLVGLTCCLLRLAVSGLITQDYQLYCLTVEAGSLLWRSVELSSPPVSQQSDNNNIQWLQFQCWKNPVLCAMTSRDLGLHQNPRIRLVIQAKY